MNETLLIVGGIYKLSFAVFHLLFWKIFDWKIDLPRLKLVNRAIVQVLNLCLTFVFIAFGVLSLLYSAEMAQTDLGRALISVAALFWLLRAVEQIVFFGLKSWISSAFLIVFIGGFCLYSMALFIP